MQRKTFITFSVSLLLCSLLLVCSTACFLIGPPVNRQRTVTVQQSARPNHQLAFFTYDCTRSYISNDPGYGHYTHGGGCLNGTATMELQDHKANLDDAYHDCIQRGMRLPTVHELSSAGRYPELGLSEGNYWAASPQAGTRNQHNCYMPTGNCGVHNRSAVQRYRCVKN